MSVENKTIDGRRVVRINGALSIWEAAATWGALYPLLCSAEPLSIDLTAVEGCDGAGIQILCQLRKLMTDRAGEDRISGISHELRAALRLAGLDADPFAMPGGEA